MLKLALREGEVDEHKKQSHVKKEKSHGLGCDLRYGLIFIHLIKKSYTISHLKKSIEINKFLNTIRLIVTCLKS